MDFEVIDFHVHPFTDIEHNFCFYGDTISSPEEFGEDIKRAGISKFCGSVIKKFAPKCFEDIANLNDAAMKAQEYFGNMCVPGIHIHPDYPEESVKEIVKYSDKGYKLIGELCPYLMGWKDVYTESLYAAYSEANKRKMVVSFHSFANNCLDQSVLKALSEFPDIIFVAAHPHERTLLDEHIERLKKYDNYYLDLSGTGIARYGTVKRIVDKAGSDKVLFGSDYPINNPKMYVEAVLYENISDKDKENIFSLNAKRILRI